MDAHDWLTRPYRTGAVGQHHRDYVELADGLLGKLGEDCGQAFLPSIELESLNSHSVVLPSSQPDEGDHAAAAIRVKHISQPFRVKSLWLDEHVYAVHNEPSGSCA